MKNKTETGCNADEKDCLAKLKKSPEAEMQNANDPCYRIAGIQSVLEAGE
jgi:hypothetical protein